MTECVYGEVIRVVPDNGGRPYAAVYLHEHRDDSRRAVIRYRGRDGGEYSKDIWKSEIHRPLRGPS